MKLRSFSRDLIEGARRQATDVLAELAGRDEVTRRIHTSYLAFRERTTAWSRISIEAVLSSRG